MNKVLYNIVFKITSFIFLKFVLKRVFLIFVIIKSSLSKKIANDYEIKEIHPFPWNHGYFN